MVKPNQQKAVTVAVKRLPHGMDLDLPAYATADAAGCDLVAALDQTKTLSPGATALIPTGIAIALPSGFEAQVRPRSGLALKHSVTVLNSPGTIDADYRGELGVILVNHGTIPFEITPGLRIAQLVIAPIVQAEWKEQASLDDTGRGQGGFGSTGTT